MSAALVHVRKHTDAIQLGRCCKQTLRWLTNHVGREMLYLYTRTRRANYAILKPLVAYHAMPTSFPLLK